MTIMDLPLIRTTSRNGHPNPAIDLNLAIFRTSFFKDIGELCGVFSLFQLWSPRRKTNDIQMRPNPEPESQFIFGRSGVRLLTVALLVDIKMLFASLK